MGSLITICEIAAPDMAKRCFRYNSQLTLQLDAPVLTTVVYLFPPGPRERDLVFRLEVSGRAVNEWRFDVVRLWEEDARKALASDSPGLLALVPLMSGGADLEAIAGAARRIERALPQGRSDAEAILLLLAGRYYTVEELARVVGREKMIQSSVWQTAKAEGEAKGRVAAERELCLALVKKHHPTLSAKATPVIDACDDPSLLRAWALSASDRDEKGFASLLGI